MILFCRTARDKERSPCRASASSWWTCTTAPAYRHPPHPGPDRGAPLQRGGVQGRRLPARLDALLGAGRTTAGTQVTSELALERSGPERFLSSFTVLKELVARARGRTMPRAGGACGRAAVGAPDRAPARLCRFPSRGCCRRAWTPPLEAVMVKDLGAVLEQEIPEIARGLTGDLPDEAAADADFHGGPRLRTAARAVVFPARRHAGNPARHHRARPGPALKATT